MLISLNWIKYFVKLPQDLSAQELGDLVTLKTAEVEQVLDEKSKFEKMVVGEVIELKPHPDADKLQIAITDIGEKAPAQIVCGGANLKQGMKVAVAKIGAIVSWHGTEVIEMKKVKIRGVESSGMICAGNEIGIDDPNAGKKDILDLGDTDAKPGTPLHQHFQKDDIILEVDNKSLTHRPDLWGHYGFAREIAAITDQNLAPFETKVELPNSGETPTIEVENTRLCPRYCGLIIKNVTVQESPDWLKQRLQATEHGLHNNIVDVTNYVMAELGQPMHAFDQKNIQEKIIVRNAQDGEKITTLDGNKIKLDPEDLVIADANGPVAIAGVIGGENSGINQETKTIILESANFNATHVRRTSVNHGVRTNSVQRFEKSLDPHLAETAIKRAAELILQVSPDAKIAGPIVDINNFEEKENRITLSIKKALSKIGIKDLNAADIKRILESLEFTVSEKDSDTFEVLVPSFRSTKDVEIEDDLIEEIARIYGYENIDPTLPTLPTKLPEANEERFKKHQTRKLLGLGLGFHEVANYSFYSLQDLQAALLEESGHIQVLNYLSEDQTHMRKSLVPNLLKAAQQNLKNFPELQLFEIGHCYADIGEYMPLEEKWLALMVVTKKNEDKAFYQAKGALETFFEKFDLHNLKTVSDIDNAPYAHQKKASSYLEKNGQNLGHVFMLHPLVQQNFDLQGYDIAIAEVNFTELIAAEKKIRKYLPINKFPTLDLDISVVIDRETEVKKLENAIKQAEQNLIQSIELFDLYQGEKIEADKKAAAFKVALQAPDRTLTDEEMASIQTKIFQNLEKIGGHIRGK